MRRFKKTSVASLVLAFAMIVTSTGPAFATGIKVETGVTQEHNEPRKTLPASFGMPSTFPEVGNHPRVMFTKADIPDIRKNMSSEEGAFAVQELNKLLAIEPNGMLPDALTGVGSNIDYKMLAVIEAHAFDYAINGNTENGQKAVEATKNFIKTFKYNPNKGDVVRQKGVVIYLSALVYDWCYPLMTTSDKKLFVDNAEKLASTISGMGGWPMTDTYVIHGHNSETHIQRDLLAFSIASYDEYPDIYNLVAGYVMNGLAPAKNYMNRSGSYHQGVSYTHLRFQVELFAQFLFHRMDGTKLYNDDMAKVPYMMVYNNRPDGRSIPEGDVNGDVMGDKIPTWTREDLPNLLYASSIWDDGFLKGEYMRYSKNNTYMPYNSFHPLLTPVNFLIVNDPDLVPKQREDLPYTRMFGSPNGLMVARTGMNDGVGASDAIAWAKIGEEYVANHAHLDSGSFQIYYKGPLAWDFGSYDRYGSPHDANYAKETISHNSLLIYDPDEVMTSQTNVPPAKNSGGMRRDREEIRSFEDLKDPINHTADLLGMEYGENQKEPEYSYISGDIAPAYSDKVSEVRRSMLFMPTQNEEKPAIFVVMDKVVSSNPTFKKSFLIHSLQEPTVEGNVTTIKRDTIGYNGKLTVQTLYPQNPVIEKIGGFGKQYWVIDENFPPAGGKYHADYDSNTSNKFGWGRVEISPSVDATDDYFLNVMYVSDADNMTPVDKADLIETNELLGARIMNKVTLFGKDRQRVNKSMTFTVPGEGTVAVALAGITEGGWKITDASGTVQTKTASKEGGIIYFTGPAGTYTVTPNALLAQADR